VEFSPKTPVKSGRGFYATQLEHTRRFLGLSRHFTVMSTGALVVTVVGISSLLSDATKIFEVFLPMV
jgi:hypothetical protein